MRLSWNASFELLKEYLEIHDGNYPATDEKYKDFNLGGWVHRQRTILNNGILLEDGRVRYKTYERKKEEIEKLKSIDFKYLKPLTFNEKFELLKEYIMTYKKYPLGEEKYKDFSIGIWVLTLRAIYNKGERLENGTIKYRRHCLTKNEVDMLDSIGFIWKVRRTWNESFELLKEYLEGKNTNIDNYILTDWCRKQRLIYNRGKKDSNGNYLYMQYILTPNQIELLNSINFVWDIQENSFTQMFNLLVEYINITGCYPITSTIYKNKKLGKWINKIRAIKKNGDVQEDGSYIYDKNVLTKEQIDALNNMGFLWNSSNSIWLNNFNLVKDFLKEYKRFPKYKESYKDKKIGNWCISQRKTLRNGVLQEDGSYLYDNTILDDYKIEKLNSINFPWILNQKKFNNEEIKDINRFKIILYSKLKKTLLEYKKGTIESKEDIDKINENFLKTLGI